MIRSQSRNLMAAAETWSREHKSNGGVDDALWWRNSWVRQSGEQSTAVVEPRQHECADEVGGEWWRHDRAGVGLASRLLNELKEQSSRQPSTDSHNGLPSGDWQHNVSYIIIRIIATDKQHKVSKLPGSIVPYNIMPVLKMMHYSFILGLTTKVCRIFSLKLKLFM